MMPDGRLAALRLDEVHPLMVMGQIQSASLDVPWLVVAISLGIASTTIIASDGLAMSALALELACMDYTVKEYTDALGNSPYAIRVQSIQDESVQTKVLLRVRRMNIGHFGDSKSIGNGLSELRIHDRPGYRVYYGRQHGNVCVLLCGGYKSAQSRDIR